MKWYNYLCCILLVCMLTFVLPRNAYAETTYTVEVGDQTLSQSLGPYFDGTQIMVPFRAITESLGGIWMDVPTGTAHKAAVLNDRVFYIITGMNCHIVFSLTEDFGYGGTDTVEDYLPIIMDRILDGTILVRNIDYPIVEKDEDIYFPLDVFVSAFALETSVSGSTVHFNPNFVSYQPHGFNVTFRLDMDNSKTYDGKPLICPEGALTVYCNGVQVTDYLPLSYDYMYTDMQMNLQGADTLPVEAGAYALSVRTNPNDPKYSGTGYFSFMIYPAELILTAKDESISVGSRLPRFSYEIAGIIPGEELSDALAEEPTLSVRLTDTSLPGTYRIEISGGTAGKNYIIKHRQDGILTISPSMHLETIQIRCVDVSTNELLLTQQQQATADSTVTIEAPVVTGYHILGSTEQEIAISGDTFVTFYYIMDDVEQLPDKTIYLPYITGYADGIFRPQNSITRGECAAMLYRILMQNWDGERIGGQTGYFADVAADAWYHNAISFLVSIDIVNGYADGTFRAERFVTRSEFVVMMLRLAGLSPGPNQTENSFPDVPHTHWANQHIRTAIQYGLVSGYPDGSFHPEQSITRAEAVSVLNRVTGRDFCVVADETIAFSDVPVDFWAYEAIMLAANNSIEKE